MDQVTLILTDSGIGDDCVENGIIVDPSGLGTAASTNDINVGDVGGGSCFIDTMAYGLPI